ncbi:hypothetical protein B9Z19DRAFT_1087563 [Tuber borchii]|uniref:Uncharacterized protein n=1 Tax=Tuber borchii TaxID=42251 RepID=A0A2T6ZN45_TUBBO|nr:hypothetical protein B9Z19DRAFT_1087563 [Tuber borchii]
MSPLLPALFYPLLCAFGIWVFCIYSPQSGLAPAIEKAIDSGFMPDGTPLIQKYTGHEWTDGLLVTLDAVFFPLTWKSNDGTIEHLQNLFAGVAVILTAMLADAYRPKSNFLFRWPSIWSQAAQVISGAILCPIYYLISAYFPPSGQPSVKAVAAIPYSILVGAILPTIIALAPGILPRDEHAHQIILAIWQLIPAYVSFVQVLLVYTPLSAIAHKPKNVSKYLGNVFLALAIAAGALHFATSVYYWKNLWDMYVPHFGNVGYRDGAKNLLIWDSICIHAAALGYAVFKGRSFWAVGLMPVIGPAAVIAWLLAEAEFAEGKSLGKKDAASPT